MVGCRRKGRWLPVPTLNESMNLIAAIESSPPELFSNRTFTFDNAWLWPVLLIAALFIGYLCFDAWVIHRRNKQINEWRRRAKQVVTEDLVRK